MHDVKLRRLSQDHPAISVRHLDVLESDRIRAELKHRLNLGDSIDGLHLVRTVRARSTMLSKPDAESTGFNLLSVFEAAGIVPERRVLINWRHFDDLDEVDAEQISKHFEYFWYPKADDIEIFDRTLGWLVSVDHEGAVWVARLQ